MSKVKLQVRALDAWLKGPQEGRPILNELLSEGFDLSERISKYSLLKCNLVCAPTSGTLLSLSSGLIARAKEQRALERQEKQAIVDWIDVLFLEYNGLEHEMRGTNNILERALWFGNVTQVERILRLVPASKMEYLLKDLYSLEAWLIQFRLSSEEFLCRKRILRTIFESVSAVMKEKILHSLTLIIHRRLDQNEVNSVFELFLELQEHCPNYQVDGYRKWKDTPMYEWLKSQKEVLLLEQCVSSEEGLRSVEGKRL